MADNSNSAELWCGENLDNVDERFKKYFNKKRESDVIFLIGEDQKSIWGHKFVLSKCSWEFFNIFNNLKLDTDYIVIKDVTLGAFMCFLKHCYTNKAILSRDDKAFEVLKLAQRFQMKQLIAKCESHLKEIVTRDNCLIMYSKSTLLGQDSDLKKYFLETIECHFGDLISHWDTMKIFIDLPLDELRDIAKSDNLSCNEMEFFTIMIKWANHNCQQLKLPTVPKMYRELLYDVLYEIRFPIMNQECLLEIIVKYPELLTHKEISEIYYYIKNKTGCYKFKNTPRKFGLGNMPMSIEGKQLVQCFRGELELPENELTTSSNITLEFCPAIKKQFYGFGFIATRGEEVELTSCALCMVNCKKEKMVYKRYNVSSMTYKRYNLDFSNELVVALVDELVNVSPFIWYYLDCKLNQKVSYLSNKSREWTEENKESEITDVFIRSDKGNNFPFYIPYLILEQF